MQTAATAIPQRFGSRSDAMGFSLFFAAFGRDVQMLTQSPRFRLTLPLKLTSSPAGMLFPPPSPSARTPNRRRNACPEKIRCEAYQFPAQIARPEGRAPKQKPRLELRRR